MIPYLGEILALSAAVVWSIAVILFKKAGETVHPLSLNLFKNTVGFVLLIPTILIVGKGSIQDISLYYYLLFIASGILGIGISDTLFFHSLNMLGASRSAVVDLLYSPFIISLSILWIGESLSGIQVIGVMLIISGVFAVSSEKSAADISRKNLFIGILLGAGAMATMAVGIVMIKPALENHSLLMVTQIRIIGGIIILLVILLFHPKRKQRFESLLFARGWKYMVPASIFGTYLALIFWLGGMKYTQASTAAALNQTSNIFIFIAAAIFLKEKINRAKLFGIGLGIPGVFMVMFG
ncbi:MAG: DMT family transporter [Candidatus Electryonea clarkiae]|nr:DMT family transporter [Candidatus Electryonea clarkiae]